MTSSVAERREPEQTSKTALKELEIETRQELVAAMLRSGISRRGMVGQLERQGIKVSLGTVAHDCDVVRRQWRDRASDSYEAHAAEQVAIIDGVIRGHQARAEQGNVRSAEVILGALDRRERVLGLDLISRARVGLEARALALEEEKVAIVARAIDATLTELGVDPALGRPVLAKHLRAIEAGGT